jgi:DNA-binding response OmpR family regulator
MSDKKARILVIDDDPNLLKMMELLLDKANYGFQVAHNGVEGLSVAQSFDPDLIVLDMAMPFMKGTEVCRRLRAESQTSRTPIIIMSNLERVEDKLAGFQAGADDYVTKPVNPKELLARINALLVRSRFTRAELARTIAVTGAKGGVGVTTVVANLAAALTQREQTVLIVELHAGYGALRHHFNAPPEPNLGRLLDMDADAVMRPDVERRLMRHESGIRLLLAPERTSEHPLTPEHVGSILKALERSADYVILDLPPTMDVATRRALDFADRILFVTEPESLSALCARTRLYTYADWNLGQPVSTVAVSRTSSGTSFTRIELENELGLGQSPEDEGGWREEMAATGVIAMIPPMPEAFQDAVRAGVPLVRMEPAARSARALDELAEKIVNALAMMDS